MPPRYPGLQGSCWPGAAEETPDAKAPPARPYPSPELVTATRDDGALVVLRQAGELGGCPVFDIVGFSPAPAVG